MSDRNSDLTHLNRDIVQMYINGSKIRESYDTIQNQCSGSEQVLTRFQFINAYFAYKDDVFNDADVFNPPNVTAKPGKLLVLNLKF